MPEYIVQMQRRRALLIFGVMVAASLFSCFHQVGLATVSHDVARSLGANAAGLGLLSAAFSYTYAAMQIPAGMLVDKLGARRTVPPFLLCAALGTALFAATDSVAGAAFSRVFIGMGLSMIAVPLMQLTAVWFPPQKFGQMTAISFTFGGGGYWLATSPVAYAAEMYGWRTPFRAIALIMAVTACFIWFFVLDSPRDLQRGKLKEASLRAGSKPEIGETVKMLVRNRQLWLLGFWYFFQGGAYFSFVGLWGGQYLMQVLRMDPVKAGWILSLAACAIMTAPLFTWITSRMGKRRPLLVALPIFSVFLPLPLIFGVENWPPMALCALFLSIAMASIGGAAVVFDAAKALFPVFLSGTVCGFINMFPLVGGALLQQAIGFIINTQMTGGVEMAQAFTTTFIVYCAIAFLALLLGVKLSPGLSRRTQFSS